MQLVKSTLPLIINHVLRNIGFTERQIKHIHQKWSEDIIVAKGGVQNFVLPSKSGNQETTCISNRKLPIALTKISITPKMKQNQPELASKLELYQDKCADVLASVFILDTINTFTKAINDTLLSLNERMSKLEESQEQVKKSLPKKRFSYWNSKMFPKYQLLMDYFEIPTSKNGILYKEFHNTYQDIEINQIVDDYCYDNGLESCFTLESIEHDKTVRKLFESMVDGLLDKYELLSENITVREKTIFDN